MTDRPKRKVPVVDYARKDYAAAPDEKEDPTDDDQPSGKSKDFKAEPALKKAKKAGGAVVVLGEGNTPRSELGYTQFRDASSANVEEAEADDLSKGGLTHLLETLHPNTSGVERFATMFNDKRIVLQRETREQELRIGGRKSTEFNSRPAFTDPSNNRAGFLYRWVMAPGTGFISATRSARLARVTGFLEQCWGARFLIREESWDLPQDRSGDSTMEAVDDIMTIPGSWLIWKGHTQLAAASSQLPFTPVVLPPDNLAAVLGEAPVTAAAQTATERFNALLESATKADVVGELRSLTSQAYLDAPTAAKIVDRGPSRSQSRALNEICDGFLAMSGLDKGIFAERYPAVGDVAKMIKFVIFNLDGFIHIDKKTKTVDQAATYHAITLLRNLLLFYVFCPFKSSASDHFKEIKSRVDQFYMQLPDDYAGPGPGIVNPMAPYEANSWMWKSWLCRTPATKQVQQRMLTIRSVLKGKQHSYHVVYRDAKKMVMACDQPEADDGQRDMYSMVLFVQSCTGMRMNEVFRPWIEMMPATDMDMEFMPQNWMVQRGTSKQSDARLIKFSGQKESFQGLLKREVKKPIAFGYSYDYVKARLDIVRELAAQRWSDKYPDTKYQDATAKQLGQMFNGIVNTRMRKMFAPLWAFARRHNMPFGSHVCRALYANIAWEEWSRSLPHTSKPGFMADVLLHDPGNLNTTTRYATVNVSMELPATLDVDAKASMENLQNFVIIANDNMQGVMQKMAQIEDGSLPVVCKPNKSKGKPADVTLQNVGGEYIVLQRIKHVRVTKAMTDAEKLASRMEHVQYGLNLLQRNNINPTVSNLSKLGVSAGFVFEFRQHHADLIKQEQLSPGTIVRIAQQKAEWRTIVELLPFPSKDDTEFLKHPVFSKFIRDYRSAASLAKFGPLPASITLDDWQQLVVDCAIAAKIQEGADAMGLSLVDYIRRQHNRDGEVDFWMSWYLNHERVFTALEDSTNPYNVPLVVWTHTPRPSLVSVDLPDVSGAVVGSHSADVTLLSASKLKAADFKQNKEKAGPGELGEVVEAKDLEEDPFEAARRKLVKSDQSVNKIGTAIEAAERLADKNQKETREHYTRVLDEAIGGKTITDQLTGVKGKVDMKQTFVAEEDVREAEDDKEEKKMRLANQRLGYKFGVLAAPGDKEGSCGTELHVYVPSGKGVAVVDKELTDSIKGQWIAKDVDGVPLKQPQQIANVALKDKVGHRHIEVDVCALPVGDGLK